MNTVYERNWSMNNIDGIMLRCNLLLYIKCTWNISSWYTKYWFRLTNPWHQRGTKNWTLFYYTFRNTQSDLICETSVLLHHCLLPTIPLPDILCGVATLLRIISCWLKLLGINPRLEDEYCNYIPGEFHKEAMFFDKKSILKLHNNNRVQVIASIVWF